MKEALVFSMNLKSVAMTSLSGPEKRACLGVALCVK